MTAEAEPVELLASVVIKAVVTMRQPSLTVELGGKQLTPLGERRSLVNLSTF